MTWQQITDPFHHLLLSAVVAFLPVLFIFWALIIKKMKGYQAALLTMGLALLIAITAYGMPVQLALLSTLQGALYGLFPICWITINAVFLFNTLVKSGKFEIIRNYMASITADRRLQVLLIAFSFGSFLEGTAGFATPVAVCAAMLFGLGFDPLYAAGICLIANTAPVAFGSVGIPIIVASQVSGIPEMAISALVGRTLPVLSLILPFYLVTLLAGYKSAMEVLPATLVAGLSFAFFQWFCSNYLSPMLPDVIAGIASIISVLILLKYWKPKTIWRFPHESAQLNIAATGHPDTAVPARNPPLAGHPETAVSTSHTEQPAQAGYPKTAASASHPGQVSPVIHTGKEVMGAWAPFIILTVLAIIWGLPVVKETLNGWGTIKFNIPGLHNSILSAHDHQPIPQTVSIAWLSAAGTAILLSVLLSLPLTGLRLSDAGRVFLLTLRQLKFPIITIASILGFAFIANNSGLSNTMAAVLASTGVFFPFFAPILGWLGVFITGSDTSSNALFARLQRTTATTLGIDPVVTVAANCSGGVVGKMVSPQSIAVAAASGGLIGQESKLFRFTVKHSFIMLILICILVTMQAYLFTWILPTYHLITK